MSDPAERVENSFRTRVRNGALPARLTSTTLEDAGVSRAALAEIFESQLTSRRLDLAARRLSKEKRVFYSIGSSGHEGNAAFGRVFGVRDLAFLHYRSGAFLIERARQTPGSTPIWDMALSFAASSEDPCSGGRHKVLGSKALGVPPQTSTIASHLPKAVGAAYGASLARTHKREDADDAVVIASFGDASANHSTSQGAFNTAQWTAFQNAPMPIVFLCEDNGVGISVATPSGWIAANFSSRPALSYVAMDGRDLLDALRGAREAERISRRMRKPVFAHMRTERLMGHAGSDVEAAYRAASEIAEAEANDPLLHSARIMIETGAMSAEEILALDEQMKQRVDRAFEEACARPKLTTAEEVARPIEPPLAGAWKTALAQRPAKDAEARVAKDARARSEPQHMSRAISLALADVMAEDDAVVVFGEDVGRKGGVYGATVRLQEKFGASRVIDTPLDEQTILGFAIGLAHKGYLPIPEIQFLAYVHNAEDQLRGEAATLSFFSNGQFANPMVVRIAGLGYQKGFGGHFHNDNALAVFRDIPGLILACPSNAADAARMLRESVRLAREEGRVVVFLEPIALYPVKDLFDEGDGLMAATPPAEEDRIRFSEVGVHGDGEDVAILTYGNGAYLSRRAARRLRQDHGVNARVIDMRWLHPLPVEETLTAAGDAASLLIVDECRRTGSLSEELVTALAERGDARAFVRLCAEDTFIPLGPAATCSLPSEDGIVQAARSLVGRAGADISTAAQ